MNRRPISYFQTDPRCAALPYRRALHHRRLRLWPHGGGHAH